MRKLKLIKLICASLAFFTSIETFKGSNRVVRAEGESSGEEYTYVEDIVGYSPTLDGYSEAKVNEYVANGYKKVSDNMNAGSQYNNTSVYLLYKPTTDKSKALRKISTMETQGGYYDWDYSSFIEKNLTGIDESVNEFMNAANYYSKQVKNNVESALISKDLLDTFFVPNKTTDTTGTKLGEWLLSDHESDEFKQVLLYSNSIVSSDMMLGLLLSSIDNSTTTWLDKYVKELSNSFYNVADPDNVSDYDEYEKDYGTSLEVIHDCIKNFYELYEDTYRAVKKGKIDLTQDETTIEESIEKALSSINDGSEDTENILYIQCYEFLSLYSVYNVGGVETTLTLADIIREIARSDYKDVRNYLFALANILNPGQFFGLKTCGFSNLLLFTSFDTKKTAKLDEEAQEIYKKYGELSTLKERIKDAKQMLKESYGEDCVSIYIGTNTDLLDKNCAITTDTARDNSIMAEFDNLTSTDALRENVIKALVYVGYSAAIAAGITIFSFGVGAFVFSGASVKMLICLGIGVFQRWVSATISTVIFGALGIVGLGISAVVAVVAVILGVILLINYITKKYNEFYASYEDIPEVMIDKSVVDKQSVYTRYDAVLNLCTGKPLDINYDKHCPLSGNWTKSIQSSKWQALYVTTDERIGAPIIVKDDTFLITTHSAEESTENTYPICSFGYFSKANLNAWLVNKNPTPLYAFYYIEGEAIDASFKDEQINGMYLESVIIKSGRDANAARLAVQNKGYNLIDVNLSPDNEFASYMGFLTTNNRKQALTDIRVAWNDSSQEIYWGDLDNTYAFSSSTVDDVGGAGDNGCHISLYVTKNANLGTPILSHINRTDDQTPEGLLIYDNINDAPEGLEGISYFSGGRAANFNFTQMQKRKYWYYAGKFVFFKPETQYTHDNSKLYLSGFGIFAGQVYSNRAYLHENYDASGFYANKAKGLSESMPSIGDGYNMVDGTGVTYLEASYTYNPYRAIYDLGVFTGQDDQPALPNNVVSNNQGYCASVIYCQGDAEDYFGKSWAFTGYRTIRDSHTYINNHNSDLQEGTSGASYWQIMPRAFYCAGPTADRTPLTYEDIKVYRKKSEIPSDLTGLNSVHELKEPYFDGVNTTSQSVANIYDIGLTRYGLSWDPNTQFYMFYSAKARVKPKYIANVYSYECNSYNEAMFSLMSMGCGRIFEEHTVSKLNDSDDCFEEQCYFHNENNQALWLDMEACDDWGRAFEDHQDGVGFIGVTYTNEPDDAIGSIRVYYETGDQYRARGSKNPDDSKNFVVDTKGNTAQFKRTSDRITAETDTYMWIYTSDYGTPIEDIKMTDYLEFGTSKDMITNHGLTSEYQVVTDQNMSTYGVFHMALYYKCAKATFIKDICYNVVSENYVESLVKDIFCNGFSEVKIYQLSNKNYLVLGLTRTDSRVSAVKDIRFTDATSFETKVGKSSYINATKISSKGADTSSNLSIYYTKGNLTQTTYAITDLDFISIYEEGSGELAYDLGATGISSSSIRNYYFDFASGKTGVYLIRKTSVEWGFTGPNSKTASIFLDPSWTILLLFIALTLIPAGVAIVVKALNKKKKLKISN